MDVGDTDKPGMTRQAALIETVVHPDHAAKLADTLGRSLVTGEHFSMRYRMRRADGVYRWISSRADPMRGQDGRIVQW
nr:PAS domain-containing protein [Ensifer sp. IC4062]